MDEDDIITLEAAIAQYDLEVELNEASQPRYDIRPSLYELLKLTLTKRSKNERINLY